jgi:hypothetical protein
MNSSLIRGQWLDVFRCVGCGKEYGPDRAVVIGEIAVCMDCALHAVDEAIRDGDVEGRDPLPYPERRRPLP